MSVSHEADIRERAGKKGYKVQEIVPLRVDQDSGIIYRVDLVDRDQPGGVRTIQDEYPKILSKIAALPQR